MKVFYLAIAALISTAYAHPQFVSKIPNGANVDGVKALGHVNHSGGGKRNAFGEDFEAAGKKWTKDLCEKDSDGDGQTNGQELGDPCCKWSEGNDDVLQRKTGLSHPGEKDSTSKESAFADATCSASGSGSGSMGSVGSAGMDASAASDASGVTAASSGSTGSDGAAQIMTFSVSAVALSAVAAAVAM